MPSKNFTTTIRFTDEDRQVLATLKDVTGLRETTNVIRLAMREALMSRIHLMKGKKTR
jgi:hypothetical protein